MQRKHDVIHHISLIEYCGCCNAFPWKKNNNEWKEKKNALNSYKAVTTACSEINYMEISIITSWVCVFIPNAIRILIIRIIKISMLSFYLFSDGIVSLSFVSIGHTQAKTTSLKNKHTHIVPVSRNELTNRKKIECFYINFWFSSLITILWPSVGNCTYTHMQIYIIKLPRLDDVMQRNMSIKCNMVFFSSYFRFEFTVCSLRAFVFISSVHKLFLFSLPRWQIVKLWFYARDLIDMFFFLFSSVYLPFVERSQMQPNLTI